VLYGMAMFPMTLSDPYATNHPIFAFFVAFHIFVVSKVSDFIFAVQVDGS